jgi:hypothetical protein
MYRLLAGDRDSEWKRSNVREEARQYLGVGIKQI